MNKLKIARMIMDYGKEIQLETLLLERGQMTNQEYEAVKQSGSFAAFCGICQELEANPIEIIMGVAKHSFVTH